MKDLFIECGQRLLPKYIDEIAQTDPSRPFVSIAKTSNAFDGYVDVTFNVFSTAVNRCAWKLERRLGRSETFAPILYIGPLDIRYFIVLFAAAKTGHVVSLREYNARLRN